MGTAAKKPRPMKSKRAGKKTAKRGGSKQAHY